MVGDIDNFKHSRFPETTLRKVKWVMKMFHEWLGEWRVRLDGQNKVFIPLNEMCPKEIAYVLQYYFAEVRKVNGEQYPPRTLKEIAAAIQHYLNYTLGLAVSIFKDAEFLETRAALDAAMKKSASDGFVKPKKRAAAISETAEAKMWDSGRLGAQNPEQLIDTLVYCLGLHLALRACQEHRNLTYGPSSQLTLQYDQRLKCERIQYVEMCSKNKAFGIHQANMEPKVTYILPRDDDKSRCVVEIYKTYLSHRYVKL